jgi:putative MFS transporter
MKKSLDDLPLSRFHKRVAVVSAGGPFCDGYLLGIIAIAIPSIALDLGLTPTETGVLGAASLLGMFLGGLIFGPLTDRIGRKLMYVLNLVVFVLASVAQFFFDGFIALAILRLIMGIALGADYPIATSMATEFLPKKARGPVLSSLMLCLWAGYVLSFVVGYFMAQLGPHLWELTLATAAIPALVCLTLRVGVPESPRWLLSVGRTDEARAVVEKFLGPDADFEDLQQNTRPASKGTGLSSVVELFRRGYGKVLFFCGVFWSCQIAPSFAIKTFQPQLLTSLNLDNPLLASIGITSFTLVGTALGMFVINAMGRRMLVLATFIASTAALFLLSTPASAITLLVIGFFIMFTVSEAAGSCLQFVYPNEVFPTDLRATGVGLATCISRIGSAAGTFALPVTVTSFGATGVMLIAGAISAFGLVVSYFLAPETSNLALDTNAKQASEPGSEPVNASAP